MADENGLTAPVDIPWRLLSRRGPGSSEDPTSIATFVYVPDLPELDATYPDDRLIYFKFSASVFPFHLDVPKVGPFEVLDEAFAPVWRMIFDVVITPGVPGLTAGLKPYFLSAAPTRRALIETGVVGDYVTEGESDEVAVGRGASHLIEGFNSTTKTRNFGIGGALGGLPIGVGLSYSRGSTSLSGGREVSEQLDTTNRQASEERRELLSHMTNVNNVLTLLNGSLIGTNRLRFSLWPQPLRPLSIDPNDENLWYAELLKRRSSGIEGMQDFFAVAVVPRGEGFCLGQTLRRVSVLEPPLPDPPGQPSEPFRNFTNSLVDLFRVFAYLDGKYPQGTPLEELDVSVEDRLVPSPLAVPPLPASRTRADLQTWYDAVGAVLVPNPLQPLPLYTPVVVQEQVNLHNWATDAQDVLTSLPTPEIDTVPRPVVWEWAIPNWWRPRTFFSLQALTNPPSLPVAYKWVQDVWLEAARHDYEVELAKSPLERGTLLVDNRGVQICADVDANGAIGQVTTTTLGGSGVGMLAPVPATSVNRPWDATASMDPRMRGRAIVSAWGTAEAQLSTRLSGAEPLAAAAFSFGDRRALDIFLSRAERLGAGDRRNLPLDKLRQQLKLVAADVQALKLAGIANLSSLAAALFASQHVDRLPLVRHFVRDRGSEHAVAPSTLPPAAAQSIMQRIGATLDELLLKHQRTPPARPRPAQRESARRRHARKR